MKTLKYSIFILLLFVMLSCNHKNEQLEVEVYETSASGNKLKKITEFSAADNAVDIKL